MRGPAPEGRAPTSGNHSTAVPWSRENSTLRVGTREVPAWAACGCTTRPEMITRFFSLSASHDHEDPVQRILAIDSLLPDSDALAGMLASDPSPQVRAAAAKRCGNRDALLWALKTDTEPDVHSAVVEALANMLAGDGDAQHVKTLMGDGTLLDAVRAEVAKQVGDSDLKRAVIAAIADEAVLADLASHAPSADTRIAAAERVHSPEALRKLVDVAGTKDRGVFRIAKQRLDAIKDRNAQDIEADAVLSLLEALATKPGPILTELVELDRRWQALEMRGEKARLARCDAARGQVQARLDREQDEYRSRSRFEAGLRESLELLPTRAAADPVDMLRSELADLRAEALTLQVKGATERLDDATARLDAIEAERRVFAEAEVLAIEAEQLAAGTYIDDAKLPKRWQMLDRSIRTPELTRRFEAAMTVVEQRRLAHVKAAQEEASAVRQRTHALLHTAEQSLAAGHLKESRAASDEIKAMRSLAGTLPKPTVQRLSRLNQQLVELERWQSFGQQNARTQLCERAEALLSEIDPRELAQGVQKLRDDWKALDAQYAGVPKALWERFDRACEKAYAPAAKYLAELAAQRKEARKQREDFISAALAHAPTLLAEPRDFRGIERWLRTTDDAWRDKNLGSLEPRLWKKLDARLKEVLGPLRDTLGQAREEAKAVRQGLINEAVALAAQAMDRDSPAKVKALQGRWQEHAKSMSLPQRDERVLWEQFRVACDAVFSARQSKRKEDDDRKHAHRRELEEIVTRLDQLVEARDQDDQSVRKALREAGEQWRVKANASDPAARALDGRFRHAKSAVETMLAARARGRETAVWDTLASKARLCEALDELVQSGAEGDALNARIDAIKSDWEALPAMPSAWEQKIFARREGALKALAEPAGAAAYIARIERGSSARAEGLLELELLLGLETPADLQQQRLALQVKQLRDRFKNAVTAGADSAGERLREWCALPGIIEGRDKDRRERVFGAIKLKR